VTGAKEILLVTGLSGAGKSTVLRRSRIWAGNGRQSACTCLIACSDHPQPRARKRSAAARVGDRCATRDFDPERIVKRIKKLRDDHGHDMHLVPRLRRAELEALFGTRRRHPLALDRPAGDGMRANANCSRAAPLGQPADRHYRPQRQELAQQVRETFGGEGLGEQTLR